MKIQEESASQHQLVNHPQTSSPAFPSVDSVELSSAESVLDGSDLPPVSSDPVQPPIGGSISTFPQAPKAGDPGKPLECGYYKGKPSRFVQGNGGLLYRVTVAISWQRSQANVDWLIEADLACKWDEMWTAANNAGIRLLILKSFRSLNRQKLMWECWSRGNEGGRACDRLSQGAGIQPGFSPYGWGTRIAIDIKEDSAEYRWLSGNAHTYGFIRVLPNNPQRADNHQIWEYKPKSARATFT